MAQTTPPSLTAPPPAPQTSDGKLVFPGKADALVAWLATMVSQMTSALTNVYNNAVDCYNNAVAAAASQVAALASQVAAASSAATSASGTAAPKWVSGTTYAIGDVRWSPATALVYRRLTAGSGTTDPSADATNWQSIAYPSPTLQEVTGTSVTLQPQIHYFLSNAAATTATLPASPAAGDIVWVTVGNGRYDNVIARNGVKIMSLSEDMTINSPHATVCLRYINATLGWRIV